MRRLAAVLPAIALAACADPTLVRIPVASTTEPMRICRPAGPGPFRAVVIEHGTPAQPSARDAMRPLPCDTEAVRWFLSRSYLVALPLRRGHGDGAPLAESSGPCDRPDYVRAGLVGAQDIAAAIAFVTARPDVRPDGAVVLGVSTGGWAAIAYGSTPHPRVAALIDVSGGRGGGDGRACRPDLLTYAAAYFATTSATPMLWLYALNDKAFPPATAEALAAAYRLGGGTAQLLLMPPSGVDGHDFFFSPAGPALWGPALELYLAARTQQAALP